MADSSKTAVRIARTVDWLSGLCARLSMALVVIICALLAYEVIARYLFLAPTIWTQDVAVTMQIWLVYMSMAYVLRYRELIRITAVTDHLGPRFRAVLESFSLLIIAAFSLMATIHGWKVVEDSIRLGRRQPTMLEMPNWIAELPVLLGFALLGLQALIELARLWTGATTVPTGAGGHPQGDRA